ncbi:uncharacterized protein HemX [Silvimonas terrae]|uniref:Uncharacterized protein HemX n=1 Tax=Silvimonas terrae TaxID=300266 RepID=A0A840RI98_9NEIS|nr:uroporphyrinogen-III C-methyltransferase [Silvimonas terrae]MBB5191911.1 uncharacterized protein HemX [Silvimonas terrae]
MTQDQNSLSAALTTHPKPPRRFTLNQPGVWLAVVAIVAAGAVWVHQQHEVDGLRAKLAEQSAQAAKREQDAQASYAAAQLQLRTVQQQIALVSAKEAEAQSQQSSLASMYDTLTRSDTQRSLADIEQNLTYASQQLQLTGNVTAALTVLDAADRKLQELNKPELISLRQAVTHDMDKLKALPVLDTVGITARLNSLIDELDQLPLSVDVNRAPAAPASNTADRSWAGSFGAELWADIKALIQIRRMDKPDAALLTPDQSLFLRENMKLRLLDARTELFSHDEKGFKADLAAVNRYLAQYFDGSAKPVQNAQAALNDLSRISFAQNLPSLDSSLAAVRSARTTAERAKP